MENIKLPVAFSIIVDDVGWFQGADTRLNNGPARSGMPRFHHPDDMRALNAIGKKLNTNILCSLAMGDWDKNNRLRGIPHFTAEEDKWDCARKFDHEYAAGYFDALEESEYLDYALHGLMHSYYEDGRLVTARQYYPDRTDGHGNKIGGWRWLEPAEFEKMISVFYEIYNDWGFKKPIVDFVSPCGCRGTNTDQGNIEYAKILRKYGILYWSNSWQDLNTHSATIEGILISKGDGSITAWNAYGGNPKYLKLNAPGGVVGTHLCGHLANFVRYDPEDNFEYVDAWVEYFNKYTELFGSMLARDNAESCSQSYYASTATVSAVDGGYEIDLTKVDATDAPGLKNEFFVSLRGGVEPKACEGGKISLREEKPGFKTYRIERDGSSKVVIKI